MHTTKEGHAEVVDTLLQHGASVDLKAKVNLLAIIICNKCFVLFLILQYIPCAIHVANYVIKAIVVKAVEAENGHHMFTFTFTSNFFQ